MALFVFVIDQFAFVTQDAITCPARDESTALSTTQHASEFKSKSTARLMKETTVVHSEEKQGNSINVPPKAQQLIEPIATQMTKIHTRIAAKSFIPEEATYLVKRLHPSS